MPIEVLSTAEKIDTEITYYEELINTPNVDDNSIYNVTNNDTSEEIILSNNL